MNTQPNESSRFAARRLLIVAITIIALAALATQQSAHLPTVGDHQQINSPTGQDRTWDGCVDHLHQTSIDLANDETKSTSNLMADDATFNKMNEKTGVNEMSPLDRQTNMAHDLKYFVSEAHKKIPVGSTTILFLYPDNTVVTASQDNCLIRAVFQPTPDGKLHPGIVEEVHGNMHAAEDKKKKPIKPPNPFKKLFKTAQVPHHIPCVSPRFAKFLAGAAYSSNPQNIMQRVCSTCRLISSSNFNNLKGCAFIDRSGNLYVSFKGSSGVGSAWTSAFALQKALNHHQHWLNGVRRTYGDPYMIAGHSSGGHIATHISAGNPWRITFEGYRMKDGGKTINIVSLWLSLATPRNNAFAYPTTGHPLSAFNGFARKFRTVSSWGSAIAQLARKSCSPSLKVDTFLGCRADAGHRTLPVSHVRSNMNYWLCRHLCRGYKYYGLEYRTECFCGHRPRRNSASSNCNMRCAGDGSQMCGGPWALTMYRR